MFTLGVILFAISGIIVFGADRLFKSGKIKTIKGLLIVKTTGLALAVASALIMFYGQ
ncbi:hypothetical protein [Brassicibacter mesophilus]|uniref:hypothetical protein n=1 Tax=Brassicibacter mesophilus TaxID=745119 RepID=UPI003D233205